jgi:hypothetical protein
MPNTGSYPAVVRDWERLLAATAEHAASMRDAEDLRQELERILAETIALKASQDSAKAARQHRTQELKGMLDRGRELAMRLRGMAKARIGPKNEQISQFGVAPLRKRSRRAKAAQPTGPVQPPVAVPAPPASPAGDTPRP